jgi:glycerol kinase
MVAANGRLDETRTIAIGAAQQRQTAVAWMRTE